MLTYINLQDMNKAFGLRHPLSQLSFRPLLRPFARGLAEELLQFDASVAATGLRSSAARLAERYTGGIRVTGGEHVPARGPLLFLSNHPGIADTLALLGQISRPDLRVIALDRPFLRALPNLGQRLIPLSEENRQRASGLRRSLRYLQAGGAILTFPAGRIEPDPYIREGTLESVATWSKSLGYFTRFIPNLQIVVVIVAGVFHADIFAHPLVRLRRTVEQRELSAAALQLVLPRYQRQAVDVVFTPPLDDQKPTALNDLVLTQVRAALSQLSAKP